MGPRLGTLGHGPYWRVAGYILKKFHLPDLSETSEAFENI